MTDISKCEGKTCPVREDCWRYKAPSSNYQSYMSPKVQGEKCEYRWPLPKSMQKRLDTLREVSR